MDRSEIRKFIDTIVIVMMENRSFDHIYGHRSMAAFGGHSNVDGIPQVNDPSLANPSTNGTVVFPFLTQDGPLPNDLPHERASVGRQLARSAALGGFAMNGFVTEYERYTGTSGVLRSPPMGLLSAQDLPMSTFFADEYAICDRWFAPLPTSTHPNRLMSVSGYTRTDTTRAGLLPDQEVLFDWLGQRGVRWRVYHAGLSFFTLMPRMWPLMLTDGFRGLSALSFDAQHESAATWPQVILIEPEYTDSPVHLSGTANDNHPPTPAGLGEVFLRRVYEALVANPARWARTAMIVAYDEHGGFFDHVAPPRVASAVPANANYTEAFASAGVRVPAAVVSPFAPRGDVSHVQLDHTSILQLLAERFGSPGEVYSPSVEARRAGGIASISRVLHAATARPSVPIAPSTPVAVATSAATTVGPTTDGQRAFVTAIEEFAKAEGTPALQKFPQIAHWMTP